MPQISGLMEKEIRKTVRLAYLLHLPEQHGKVRRKWPMIVFLHGSGERGNDPEKLKVHGIPKIAERDPDFPFVALSPQCPENSFWSAHLDSVMALIDETASTCDVDPDRIYLTGMSMGGWGTWTLAIAHPDRFAAIAPVCGGENPARAPLLKELPIWVFHGAKDSVTPVTYSQAMVNALRKAGANVRFTVYEDADHDCWTATYDNPELYEWFLRHSLRDRRSGGRADQAARP